MVPGPLRVPGQPTSTLSGPLGDTCDGAMRSPWRRGRPRVEDTLLVFVGAIRLVTSALVVPRLGTGSGRWITDSVIVSPVWVGFRHLQEEQRFERGL